MIRKRRSRYIGAARDIAQAQGIPFDPTDWELIWSLIENHGEPCYVYAIVDKAASLVKFGRSVNPGQRLKALQTANGKKLQLWAFCKEEGDMTEKAVHQELKACRMGGEWFRLNVVTGQMIDRMRAQAH